MRPAFLDSMSWQMAEVYASVTDRILINLAHHFPYIQHTGQMSGSFEYQAKMLAQMGQVNKESMKIIMDSLKGADEALKGVLEASIMDALKTEEPKLRKAAQKGLLSGGVPEVSPNMMQAFQTYYRQSADKLNLVNTVMLESTQAAYTATVSDVVQKIQRTQSILNVAAGETVTGVSTWNQAMHDAVKKMVQNGITGFVDHGGHKWSPEAYVAMDIRTTMFNTAREAVWERAESYGSDIYQVSSHNGARPLCYPWQGKLISRSDYVRDVEDVDGNKAHVYAQSDTSFGAPAGLFGVNCRHYPMSFIPGFSALRGEPQPPEENEQAYAESQQQRALERKLREEKRDLEVMKAQGASEDQINAQRERVRKANADIDDFCDDTGRARRRNREYTPINATFQDNIQPTPPKAPRKQNAQKPDSQSLQKPLASATIKNAKNKEELFAAVEREYSVKIADEVKQLDFDMLKDALGGIKSITDAYPEIGEAFTEIATSKKGIMNCDGGIINFNPVYFTTKEKLQQTVKECMASGWWPKNTTVGSIGAHEGAHGIEWFIDTHNPAYKYEWQRIEAWNKSTEAKSILSEACKSIKKTVEGKGKKNAELIASISKRATEDASEALAEAFKDYYNNGAGASPLSQEVVRLTTERYKLYGGKGDGY